MQFVWFLNKPSGIAASPAMTGGFCVDLDIYGFLMHVQESYGRYLDLHELYNQFLNSKFGRPMEYSAFLEEFSQTHTISRGVKLTK